MRAAFSARDGNVPEAVNRAVNFLNQVLDRDINVPCRLGLLKIRVQAARHGKDVARIDKCLFGLIPF